MPTSRASTDRDQPAATTTLPRLGLRLAVGWWRSVTPLVASCAVLTAVIGGAFGVGDAIVDNLEQRTWRRLGGVVAMVTAAAPFDATLAERMRAVMESAGTPAGGDTGNIARDEDVVPTRLVPAVVLSLSAEASGAPRRAARTTAVGIEDPGSLGFAGRVHPLADDTVAINGRLASQLGAGVGGSIVLRMLERSAIPPDAPLGRRVMRSVGRRVTVAAILADDGLGALSLEPSTAAEPLVVMPLSTAQSLLGKSGVANAILAVQTVADGRSGGTQRSMEAAGRLDAAIRPTLRDIGLSLVPIRDDLVRLASDSLVLPPEADRAAAEVLEPLGGSPAMLFLANEMAVDGDRVADGVGMNPRDADGSRATVPYSTVAGIATTDLPYGRLVSIEGDPIEAPGPGEIVIDAWVADDLARQGRPVGRGSRLSVTFFAPETLHGRAIEKTRTFTVAGVARMEGAAVERSLVPEVEGITDKRSIAAWDPPFPFDASRVRTKPPHDEDDRYWKEHGATPKAFVSLDDAREVAAGRFGRTTTWHARLPAGTTVDDVAKRIEAAIDPAAIGLASRPSLAEGLAASRGATPFGGLFIALSSFLVIAALALEWLLARLLVSTRLPVVGTLSAIGWSPPRIARLFGGIGAAASAVGCLLGAAAGPAWAAALLAVVGRGFPGIDAASGESIFAATWPHPATMIGAAIVGLLVSSAAAWLAARLGCRAGPGRLLAGQAGPASTPAACGEGSAAKFFPMPRSVVPDSRDSEVSSTRTSGPFFRGPAGRPMRLVLAVSVALLAAAIAIAAAGVPASEEAGRFFLAGVLAVVGGCGLVRAGLVPAAVRDSLGLVRRSLVLQPARTLSVVGIVAVAEFLIVSVSAFAVRPPADPEDRNGPTGGWTLLANLAEPCSADLSDPGQLESLGLAPDSQRVLLEATISPIRVSGGEDASCLNLQRVTTPMLLGVDRVFRERGGFRFSAAGTMGGDRSADVTAWRLLDPPAAGRRRPIPAVVDEATARYALGLAGLGARIEVPDERGEPVELEVVGLLSPGILQGSLVVAEEDFLDMFPSSNGFRLLLIDVPGGGEARDRVVDAVSTAVADYGPSVGTTVSRLATLGSVQNTYLAGFQALGTLGLFLGTVGVAIVQARGLLERAGEIGLLTAIGFTPERIRGLVTAETALMVGLGLAVGAASAVVAIRPQLASGAATLPLGWALASGLGTLTAAVVVGRLVVGRLATVRPAEAIRASE